MALPSLPLLVLKTSEASEPTKNAENIERLHSYLQELLDAFPNAVGQALDPTEGFSGDGAVDIAEAPTDITYVTGTTLNSDENLVGHVDITFVPPRFAVQTSVQYRQVGVTQFSTESASQSPYRLSNLAVGTDYEVQLAGQSVNGAVGPLSDLTTLTISTASAVPKAPTDAQYWLSAVHSKLPQALVPSGETGVVDVDVPTATIGIEVNGITNAKLAQIPTNTLHGNNLGVTGNVANLTTAQVLTMVFGPADSGWSMSNVTPDKVYNANATTVDELADVLGTLIQVLIDKGILSA